MKILHLSKFYPPDPGGLEHVVACLAEGAARRGHEVRVVAATGSAWRRDPGKRVTAPPHQGVVVVRLPTHGVWWSQPVAPGYVAATRWPADVIYVHRPHPLADLAAALGPRRPTIVLHHADVQRQRMARLAYGPLAALVAEWLTKDPADRPQSAADVLARFEDPGLWSGEFSAQSPSWARRHRFDIVALGAVLVLAGLIGAGVGVTRWNAGRIAANRRSIVVLPLVDVSHDTAGAYFAAGMTDQLTGALDQVPDLRVASRTAASGFSGRAVTPPQIVAALDNYGRYFEHPGWRPILAGH